MNMTANEKRAIKRLWKSDMTTAEICEELGFSLGEVADAAVFLNLPKRAAPDIYLPTPIEIRDACAKIRSSWSPGERELRLGRLRIATQEHTYAGGSQTCDRSEGGEIDRP
jgi:hypothetical protein